MLLVHDLMLLLLDDESGRVRQVPALTELLGGALLVELAARGCLDVTGPDDEGRPDRLIIRDGSPAPTEPLLVDALAAVQSRLGKKPDRALRPVGHDVRERVVDDLVQAGIVSAERHKVLGLFPSTRHPAISTDYEDELRRRVTAVLEGRDGPDDRTGPVIALLSASDVLTKVIPVDDRKAARAVAKKVSEGDWAAASVRRAVQAVNSAAIIAATTAATTAVSTN